jgi:hypothetical protein
MNTRNANRSAVEEPATPAKKFRVQLDFEPDDMYLINELVAELRLGTRAELFRSALRTLRWMVRKRREGCAVVAVSRDETYYEPEFEFLDNAFPSPLVRDVEPVAATATDSTTVCA